MILLAMPPLAALRTVAIVTGGTRGIGRGIAEALAAQNHDLLLTYGSDVVGANATVTELSAEYGCAVECIAGDLTRKDSRDALFERYDRVFGDTHELRAVVHNAGQYIGVTSSNAAGLKSPSPLGFGDASVLGADGRMTSEASGVMRYYQTLYGDAYIDLCERGLQRMSSGGSLIGISSPGCTLQYKANLGYDMPGSGKCIMEYAMRLIALRCAKRSINCNVVIPGVTETDAWSRLAAHRGGDHGDIMSSLANRIAPMGSMRPRQVGDAVAFLCSPAGRMITGVSLPVDGGVHLRA